MVASTPIHSWINRVIDLTQSDPQLSKIYQNCLQGKRSSSDYSIQNGLILLKGKIVLPHDSALLQHIISKNFIALKLTFGS